MSKVLVSIITYNPKLIELRDNLSKIKEQTGNIVVVDNGSGNFSNLVEELEKNNVPYIDNKENKGIAYALNQTMQYAASSGFDRVLTLDQDSEIQKELISEYQKYILDEKFNDAAIFTCLIKDRNFYREKNESQDSEYKTVPYCITSGALTNVGKYFKTKGYDKSFFIDAVDFDMCYSFRELNYKIYRINYIGILHTVGHAENRRFLFWTIPVYHHNAQRIYYLSRNLIKMHRKHKKLYPLISLLKSELALLTRIIFYENDKFKKLSQYLHGIKDAIINK